MNYLKIIRKFTADSRVVYQKHNHVTSVLFNKQKSLNSLDTEMFDSLLENFKNWEKDPETKVVLFEGSGQKAYCAGGDIRALYEEKQKPSPRFKFFRDFFWKEYLSDYCMAKMRPTQVCIFDGIVMGGGYGISSQAPFKIATEHSVFAMPETNLGFFTDVGSAYFLPRLKGSLGMYLALTGSILHGKQLLKAGIANYFVHRERIPELKRKLYQTESVPAIRELVNEFSEEVTGSLEDTEEVEKNFSGVSSVEELFERLKADNSHWAQKKLQAMQKHSPISLKVIFDQLGKGKFMDLEEVFAMEFRLSQNFLEKEDFYEGVRSVLIDKDKNPKWQFRELSEVPNELVNWYFTKSKWEDLDVASQKSLIIS